MKEEEFFHTCLNLDYDGMEAVKKEVCIGNYDGAKKELAAHIRKRLSPDRFFTIPYEKPENYFKLSGETDEQACQRLVKGETMVSVGVPCSFGEPGKIDWRANPTFNQYKEWTWQFNRHHELKLLAHQYNQVKDERYAAAAARLFASWVAQAQCPGDVDGHETKCWRTIECGIRMGANWPYVLFSFYRTKSFTDEILYLWYKSVWEHGNRLSRNHTHGNWLIMEMNGLAQIGILYPELSSSGKWLEEAWDILKKELYGQIYPDGFQYELSTGYHDVVINNYQRVVEVARAFDRPVPEEITDRLMEACQLEVKLMMPDGRLPDLNDGKWGCVSKLLLPRQRLLSKDPVVDWAVSGGTRGREPEYRSLALPYSGISVMRNGWGPENTWALFDGGPFGRGHQHEDKLSLLIYGGGKLILTEGGNYAYDDSQMRKYVISTRAHNTVMVDGAGQNRRRSYDFKDSDIHKEAGLRFMTGESYDYAGSVYDEGYGPEADRSVRHDRSVYFIKKPPYGLKPFFLVVDRLLSETEHEYEFLWHLDSDVLGVSGRGIEVQDMTVCISKDNCSLEIIRAKEEPEWQGFIATGTRQGMYRPVNCLSVKASGNSLRLVTALFPGVRGGGEAEGEEKAEKAGEAEKTEASEASATKGTEVEAGAGIQDETVAIHMKDGTIWTLKESVMRMG